VEWNIGESAGFLAGFCILNKTEPHAVAENPSDFQRLLRSQGIPLQWPELRAL